MGGPRIAAAALAVLLACLWTPRGADARSSGDFSDWAVVVVAGDWRSGSGGETEAFDNARRDVSTALITAGFHPDNLRQYSLRPPRKGDDPAVVVGPRDVAAATLAMGAKAKGCLFYVTSHGTPEGAVFGASSLLKPSMLDALLDEACGGRPTVAIVSACYSGVFIPTLKAPNRLVLTASRPDRSSFGCSERDRYPYFDACVLESLPKARDFLALSAKVKACVSRMEAERGLSPPSEPQMSVGAEMQLSLPMLQFAGP